MLPVDSLPTCSIQFFPSPMQQDWRIYSPKETGCADRFPLRELSCTAPEGVVAVRLLNASLWLIAIALSLVVSLPGQETTGTITGVVTDPSGALLASAEVTATNTGTGA